MSETEIISLAKKYSSELQKRVDQRLVEMENDDNQHYLIYNVMNVSNEEGKQIDLYQNKGRFLYKYVGSFLEEAAILCIKHKYKDAEKVKIDNTIGIRPKTFEIDCLVNNTHAVEIKWRDATTDGDHINKEHTRLRVISAEGYLPIRVMFYNPLRKQAIKIQKKLEKIYSEENGKFYAGNDAWNFIKDFTGVNLFELLNDIAKKT
tara:strand:+ start:142 stop:756 length:615 start_codon:yes stop_codon:yes gene_type:complete